MKARLGSRRVQIVVIAALSLVIIHNARHFAQRSKTGRRPVEMEVPIAETLGQVEAPGWAKGDRAAASGWGRDPFDPTGKTGASITESNPGQSEAIVRAPASPRIRITGIGMVGDTRFVLAGDKILREGDRVGTGTIKKIGTKSVVVEYGGLTKTINID
ncbi:MAG: hypothetical protein ABIJ00_02405 [Candidatus Eisenbacteria bacterium]